MLRDHLQQMVDIKDPTLQYVKFVQFFGAASLPSFQSSLGELNDHLKNSSFDVSSALNQGLGRLASNSFPMHSIFGKPIIQLEWLQGVEKSKVLLDKEGAFAYYVANRVLLETLLGNVELSAQTQDDLKSLNLDQTQLAHLQIAREDAVNSILFANDPNILKQLEQDRKFDSAQLAPEEQYVTKLLQDNVLTGIFSTESVQIQLDNSNLPKREIEGKVSLSLALNVLENLAAQGKVKKVGDNLWEKGKNVGGIDLNPTIMNMGVQKNGNGVIIPISPISPENFKVDGLTPSIINVAPVTNLPLLLGLDQQPKKDSATDVSFHVSMLFDVRERFAVKELSS